MLVTDTITEATLYENGLYTRHIRLSRPVSDSKYPLPPGSQLIKNMTLRLRLQDQQEETSVTLFQGKMSTDGNNYSIIKGKVSSVLLGNDSNLLIVFYVQIMPDDFVMQLHRF